MKKECAFYLVLLAIGLSTMASALSTDLKANYDAKENMIVQISGELPNGISSSQVVFKRKHIAIAPEFDVKKIGEQWYIWAIAPEQEGNYTLSLNNIVSYVSGNMQTVYFEQNFSVGNEVSEYTIKPGFISTNQNFSLEINLNKDSPTSLSIDFPESKTINLRPGENTLQFLIDSVEGNQFKIINIGKYGLPAFIMGREEIEPIINNSNEDNQTAVIKNSSRALIESDPLEISAIALKSDELPYYIIVLSNVGGLNATNIIFSYDNETIGVLPQFKELEARKKKSIAITIRPNNLSLIRDSIILNYSNDYFIEIPIEIRFSLNESEITPPEDYPALRNDTLPRCVDLLGKVCSKGQNCTATRIPSQDGICCTGKCFSAKTAGSSSWIGWVIGGLVVIVLIYIFLKYKKTKDGGEGIFKKKVAEAEKLSVH